MKKKGKENFQVVNELNARVLVSLGKGHGLALLSLDSWAIPGAGKVYIQKARLLGNRVPPLLCLNTVIYIFLLA